MDKMKDPMTLSEALPELVADIEGALVRLGRGDIADQLREATLATWTFDDFAQATYLHLAPKREPARVEETISLYDDIPVNVDLDGDGRIMGLDVVGYEQPLSRLAAKLRADG
jgi:uncharacterized protein YuzE